MRHFDEKLRIIHPGVAAPVDARRASKREGYFQAEADKGTRMPEKTHGKYLLTGGMLLCPTCGGHFEGVKYEFKNGALRSRRVYVCATRRRKPGVCTNTLAFKMEDRRHRARPD